MLQVCGWEPSHWVPLEHSPHSALGSVPKQPLAQAGESLTQTPPVQVWRVVMFRQRCAPFVHSLQSVPAMLQDEVGAMHVVELTDVPMHVRRVLPTQAVPAE